VMAGNLVFYIATGIGKIDVDGHSVYVISESSPVGLNMAGLKQGNLFELNGKQIIIDNIV